MSNPFVELLGPSLVKGDGSESVSTADALSGKKVVGLYFSAHWCPPCRGFTPVLAKCYTENYSAKGMEIVFVSSDRDEASFKSYFGEEQPWLALPYSAREIKAKLSKKYKVQGIPSFIILDGETGATITADGRECVSEDPTGKDLPWKPPGFWDALGSEFLSGTEGETVDVDELKSSAKYIGLYFSAHWCPPCRGFTPDLIKAYKEHLKAKGLEIIFVSSDRDQASFMEYYGSMPWLAIPQGDARKAKLSKLFGVEGIPSFAVVDAATGETINGNARGKVSSDPTGAKFPWIPPALVDIDDDGPDGINDELSLVALLEKCDAATTAAAVEALSKVAEASKAAKADTLFFVAPKEGQIAGKIRELTKLGAASATPQLVLLDIPDEGGYYVSPATEVTADTIGAFLEGHKSKALERKQLG